MPLSKWIQHVGFVRCCDVVVCSMTCEIEPRATVIRLFELTVVNVARELVMFYSFVNLICPLENISVRPGGEYKKSCATKIYTMLGGKHRIELNVATFRDVVRPFFDSNRKVWTEVIESPDNPHNDRHVRDDLRSVY